MSTKAESTVVTTDVATKLIPSGCDTLNLNLQPSKYYLIVSTLIYGLCLVLVWWRLDSIWVSSALSIAIAISAVTFYPKYVLLAKENSITSITLGKVNASFNTKDSEVKSQHKYQVTYQSRLLIIIRFSRVYVPIFKDSVNDGSLSSLNRFINIG
jgi:hypothetical protein